MIIFYNKKTGNIVGTIDGRVHNDKQLNMWVGDKEETERIVIEWEKSGSNYKPKEQKEIAIDIDNDHRNIKKYKVNIKNHTLELKGE